MAVVLVMRVCQMVHLCGNFQRATLPNSLPGIGYDLQRS